MEADIAAIVAAALFGTAAVMGAGGVIFLGVKALRLLGHTQSDLRDSVQRLEAEIGEMQERLDSHERVLQQQRETPKLESDR